MEMSRESRDDVGKVPWIQRHPLLLLFKDTRSKVDYVSELREMYSSYPWGDTWEDAGMRQVVCYLRGSKRLQIPSSWRAVMQDVIPYTTSGQ